MFYALVITIFSRFCHKELQLQQHSGVIDYCNPIRLICRTYIMYILCKEIYFFVLYMHTYVHGSVENCSQSKVHCIYMLHSMLTHTILSIIHF